MTADNVMDLRDVRPSVVGAGDAVYVRLNEPNNPLSLRLTTMSDALELACTFVDAARQLRNVELDRARNDLLGELAGEPEGK